MENAWRLLTKIHLLVAAGTHVGLPGESGDAASWGQITGTLLGELEKVQIVNHSPRREINVLLKTRGEQQ